jgi:hypothetical protein
MSDPFTNHCEYCGEPIEDGYDLCDLCIQTENE